jgi:hypothetical protein
VSGDGASYWRADVADQDFAIRYFNMTIEGLEGKRVVVAKLRRVSSPPVQVGTVSGSMASALGRLVDIIRLGKDSRNYADLKAVEWALAPDYMVSAEVEWAEDEQVACRVLEGACRVLEGACRVPYLASSFQKWVEAQPVLWKTRK